MTSFLENVYINKLAATVNEYNNIYYKTKKWRLLKSSLYIGFPVENNDEDPIFEVSGHVRISNYKNIFAKDYTPNWSEWASVIIAKRKWNKV